MAADLPVSAKDLIRFTPAVYESEPEDERPVYLIAVPSLTTRPRWQRDLAAAGAFQVDREKTKAFLRDAVSGLLEGEARAAALDDLDRVEELGQREEKAESNGLAFSDQEKAELVGLVARITELGAWAERTWPPYAELVAQADYWLTMARLLAAKHFLRGWKGVTEPCAACGGSGKQAKAEGAPAEAEPAPCARCDGRGRVPLKFKASREGFVDEAVLDKLPRADVFDIGFKAMMHMRLDNERRKN